MRKRSIGMSHESFIKTWKNIFIWARFFSSLFITMSSRWKKVILIFVKLMHNSMFSNIPFVKLLFTMSLKFNPFRLVIICHAELFFIIFRNGWNLSSLKLWVHLCIHGCRSIILDMLSMKISNLSLTIFKSVYTTYVKGSFSF